MEIQYLLVVVFCGLNMLCFCQALYCYTCEDCEQKERNSEWRECDPGQFCYTSFTVLGLDVAPSVSKRCVDECQLTWIQDCGSRGCVMCCDIDRCNKQNQDPIYDLRYIASYIESDASYREAETSTTTTASTTPSHVTCPPGPMGPAGSKGFAGPPGMNGLRGLNGRRGFRGTKGVNGDDGYDGLTGLKGDPGFPGRDGLRGITGQKGKRGFKGHPGFPGLDGEPGMTGPRGRTGDCECGEQTEPIAFHGKAFNIRQTQLTPEPVIMDEISVNRGFENATIANNDTRLEIPRSGLYSFYATSVANGNVATPLVLMRNDTVVLKTGQRFGNSMVFPLSSNHVIVNLQEGDVVQLMIPAREEGNDEEFGSFNNFISPSDITFSGFFFGEN